MGGGILYIKTKGSIVIPNIEHHVAVPTIYLHLVVPYNSILTSVNCIYSWRLTIL